MDNRIKVTGMVLSVMPVGDYDRRVTILTKERGKIAAFARGARRPGSVLIAATQPCVFGSFSLFSGRDSFTIGEVVVDDYFSDIREDIEKAYMAMYFCELADYYAREGSDEREMLKLLYASLKAMIRGQMSLGLIRAVYELKAVCINGEAPLIGECASCHKSLNGEPKKSFHVSYGGICPDCRRRLPAEGIIEAGDAVWYALWFIINTPVAKLFAFKLTPDAQNELERLAASYLKARTEHEFKGEKLLKLIGPA